jgi:hypothetical protein
MHEEAFRFVAGVARRVEPRVSSVELGSRTVAGQWPYSGSVCHLFPGARYVGVDAVDGANVGVVNNEATWQPESFLAVDTVVCTETLEHMPGAAKVCSDAWSLLQSGGVFIVSAAEGRAGSAFRHRRCD